MATNKRTKVAVVGGGVAGLSAAWHLLQNASSTHEVHLFEAADRLGGHAHTVSVTTPSDVVDVDIGFMVFNRENYPNMRQWFQALGVTEEASDMSLGVSLDGGDTVEWNSDGLSGLFAKRSQAYSPKFYRFVQDMLRFNQEAPNLLRLHAEDPRRFVTTGQYLRDHGYSEAFASYYLLPMMAALWSASIEDVLNFPAEQLIGFLCNHKMLQLFERPQWKTVAGRSQVYTLKMKELLGARAHFSTPIVAVHKCDMSNKHELFTDRRKSLGIFDHVIFACHPPTAMAMLKTDVVNSQNRTELLELLGNIEYADNVVYVHSDPKLMPQRSRAWASWNCLGDSSLLSLQNFYSTRGKEALEGGASGFGNTIADKQNGYCNGHATNGHTNNGVSSNGSNGHYNKSDETVHLEGKTGRMKAVYVTYWLNRLQNLKTDQNVFVSLNPHERPDPSLTYERVIMAHPQFNPKTLQARKQLLANEFQGKDGLWFCGAWEGYGFHEDGCRSGFQVATTITGIPLPWCSNNDKAMVCPPPDLSAVQSYTFGSLSRAVLRIYKTITHDFPIKLCRKFVYSFLQQAIQKGRLELKFNDGSKVSFGDGSLCGCDDSSVTLRVFDPWFFVKVALEYDIGVARSYMAGHFVVEPLKEPNSYDPVIRPPNSRDETTVVLGDPIGLTRFFLLLIGNRDKQSYQHVPRQSAAGYSYSNALTNASGLVISRLGSLSNYLRFKFFMDNSEKGGSLTNIHAHYDLSNDLFQLFLDKETLMYSSAIYDAVKAPNGRPGLVFRGSLEQAQWRKLQTFCDRAQLRPGHQVLDIGFGWGGLSIFAAKNYGCHVTGITLSVEQKALAEERVKKEGLENVITFEVIDYRTFARRPDNCGRFDRVLCCEMIEAVGHGHLAEYFWAVEQVLARDGILVMEAITTPEARYETYRRSADLINTIIFPGSCCPSLHALVDAAYKGSYLTLEHIDNIGLHYAQTLAEWRRRFNSEEETVRRLGFDDVFLRVWNYYFAYCEAGFFSQTENCLILVFARQGCRALAPLCETRFVTQELSLTDGEVAHWLNEVSTSH